MLPVKTVKESASLAQRLSDAEQRLQELLDEIREDLQRSSAMFAEQWSATGWLPAMDVVDQGENIVATVEVPGMAPDQITVEVTDHTLVIRGEKKVEGEETGKSYYTCERRFGAFERAVSLMASVNSDKAEAMLANGLLIVTLPKAPIIVTMSRRIAIVKSKENGGLP